MSTTETEPAKASVHLLSCSELVRLQEARRETRNGPQPWIFRKLTVGIVVLIVGWVTYVYVGRVCVRVIRRDDGVVGSRALGSKQPAMQTNGVELTLAFVRSLGAVTLVVLFSLLWFFFVWSYAKVRIPFVVFLNPFNNPARSFSHRPALHATTFQSHLALVLPPLVHPLHDV